MNADNRILLLNDTISTHRHLYQKVNNPDLTEKQRNKSGDRKLVDVEKKVSKDVYSEYSTGIRTVKNQRLRKRPGDWSSAMRSQKELVPFARGLLFKIWE